MNDPKNAIETQLRNIQAKTGKTIAELGAIVHASGLNRHGEIRDMLKHELGLGHGDANTLVHHLLKSDGASKAAAAGASPDEVLGEIYSGAKTVLRPIHDRLMGQIEALGPFETAPKKGYVSLRRKKQFATIGPATNTRVEVGLNMKGVPATERLVALPPGGMCQYKVKLSSVEEVDPELVDWIRQAFESAG